MRHADDVQGHVINISSIAATDHYAGGSIYCGTKAFVTAFTDSLRHDLVGTNIRCRPLDHLLPIIMSIKRTQSAPSCIWHTHAPCPRLLLQLVTCWRDTPIVALQAVAARRCPCQLLQIPGLLCRVTAISPGAVQTEFSNIRFKAS